MRAPGSRARFFVALAAAAIFLAAVPFACSAWRASRGNGSFDPVLWSGATGRFMGVRIRPLEWLDDALRRSMLDDLEQRVLPACKNEQDVIAQLGPVLNRHPLLNGRGHSLSYGVAEEPDGRVLWLEIYLDNEGLVIGWDRDIW